MTVRVTERRYFPVPIAYGRGGRIISDDCEFFVRMHLYVIDLGCNLQIM